MSNFMKIKLLHAVLRDGHRVEAGEIGNIEEMIAEELIASGAAVAIEEPAPVKENGGNDAGNAAPKEPEPLIQPEAGQSAASPAAPVDPTPPAPAEPDAKPAKAAKEGK